MPRERLAEVLRRVDPNLRIVEARPWPGKRQTRMSRADWEKAAITCPVCRQPTARLLPYGFLGKRKACPKCIERRARLLEYEARIFEARRRR